MEPPASASELPAINKDLKNYIDNADAKASSEGGDTAKAKIASAAYWLVNNNYYKVQYGSSDLSQYNVDGWNQSWDKNTGLDSLGFVKWSLKQAGSSESIIQNPRKTSNNFTVEELINGGIKVGDIISRNETSENGTKTSNSHWAIVTEVTESYIKVAHAVNEQIDLTITTYHLGEQINYQNIY